MVGGGGGGSYRNIEGPRSAKKPKRFIRLLLKHQGGINLFGTSTKDGNPRHVNNSERGLITWLRSGLP